MTSLNQTMDSLLRRALAKPEPLSLRELEGILRLMGKWRHQMISNSIIARDGPVVQAGPFAGMRLATKPSDSEKTKLHRFPDTVARSRKIVRLGCGKVVSATIPVRRTLSLRDSAFREVSGWAILTPIGCG
jgi:hypothetical protein